MSEQFQKSTRWFFAALAILIVGGCAAPGRNTPFGTIDDSTAYAPQYRSYGPTTAVASPTQSQRVEKPVITDLEPSIPQLSESEFEETEEVIIPEPDPRISPYREVPNEETGPLFAPEPLTTPPAGVDDPGSVAPPARLLLEIVRPERVTLDGDVRFDVTIRNDTANDVEDVDVYCTFEEGLQFPGKEETELRRNIGRVAAGDSQTMSLTLIAKQLGRHCANSPSNQQARRSSGNRYVRTSPNSRCRWTSSAPIAATWEAALSLP